MPKTLFEKIWQAHIVREEAGEPALLYIDLHLVHEVTSPQAFEGLRIHGRSVRSRTCRSAVQNACPLLALTLVSAGSDEPSNGLGDVYSGVMKLVELRVGGELLRVLLRHPRAPLDGFHLPGAARFKLGYALGGPPLPLVLRDVGVHDLLAEVADWR